MNKVAHVYDEIFEAHDTGDHIENIDRLTSTKEYLINNKIIGTDTHPEFTTLAPRQATREEIRWIHSESFLQHVQSSVARAKKKDTQIEIDPDTVVSAQSYDASLYSVGGNLLAIEKILAGELNSAFVLCRPPGHHSNRDTPRGFCVFNCVAVAAEYLFRKTPIRKVAILDFDAHCGDGTQEIFWRGSENGEMVFVSLHQDGRSLYPGKGFVRDIGAGKQKGRIINVPLPSGAGDKSAQLVMKEIVLPIFDQFQPEFILISAGFDGHRCDPLTSLKYSNHGFGQFIEMLHPILEKHAQNRCVATLEGGYDLESLGKSITNVFYALAKKPLPYTKETVGESEYVTEATNSSIIPKLKQILSPYWSL